MWTWNGEYLPAAVESDLTVLPGTNFIAPRVVGQVPPPGTLVSSVFVDGLLLPGFSDHGVNSVVVVFVPQVGGEVRIPLSPPKKWRRKLRNVACGFSGTIAVNCPVTAF